MNLNSRAPIEKGRKEQKKKKNINILVMANYHSPEHSGHSPSLPSARMSDSIGDKLLLSSSSHYPHGGAAFPQLLPFRVSGCTTLAKKPLVPIPVLPSTTAAHFTCYLLLSLPGLPHNSLGAPCCQRVLHQAFVTLK